MASIPSPYTGTNVPTGTAGGGLSGTYPNPSVVLDSTLADIAGVGTTPTVGAAGKPADAGHVHGGFNEAAPNTYGLLSYNFDPCYGGVGNANAVNGTLYLQAFEIHQTATVSKAWANNGVAGTTPTSGQSFLGVYNSSGTLLGFGTADSIVTTTGPHSVALSLQAGQSLTLSPGTYYGAILYNATTAPQLARGQSIASYVNFNGMIRTGTGGTVVTTLGTAVTIATTNSPVSAWFGVS